MQFLRITTTPVLYEISQQRAKLVYTNERGRLSLHKQGGHLMMRSANTRMLQDSYERQRSLGLKGIQAAASDAAQQALQASAQAVARYVDMGNQMAKIHKGANISDIYFSRMMQDIGGELTFVPISPIEISWQQPVLEREYTPVRLQCDWKSAKTSMEYIPGNVTLNIKQHPSVNIEYLGRPVYVPPSADPDFSAGGSA